MTPAAASYSSPMRYPFLSDEWIEAARTLRTEVTASAGADGITVPDAVADVRINLVVEEVPFGDGVIHAHFDTSRGGLDVETGPLDNPQATVTLDYDTARAILVDQEQQVLMQSFLGGRISIDGDVTRLLVLAGTQPPPSSVDADELAARVRAITE
jgi:hypothetical protein